MEKECIILSITVTRPGPFASDAQRLNVALTRARRHLLIVGDLNVASQLAPAFALLVDQAARMPGGVCSNVAAFVPQRLSNETATEEAKTKGPSTCIDLMASSSDPSDCEDRGSSINVL